MVHNEEFASDADKKSAERTAKKILEHFQIPETSESVKYLADEILDSYTGGYYDGLCSMGW